jgi:serpin B
MTATISAQGSDSSAGSPAPVEKVVAGNTAFAFDLYQREKESAPNLFFSPYSISTALAMTWCGARGATAEEMARTLHFTVPPPALSRAFARLADQFVQIKNETNISLSVANSLWHERDYHFLDSFLKLNREDFRAEIRPMDFRGNPEGARKLINAWVEQQTQDKIRDLLHPGDIVPATRLVLCNAIYFKGNWAMQFDPKMTRPGPFYVTGDQSVTVPMMSGKVKLRSRQVEGVTVFALPYKGNDLTMVVVLPDDRDGLAALEQRLTAAMLQEWLAAVTGPFETEVEVVLPKFKLNCRLDLARNLPAMGMPLAFRPGADFSGMDGSRELFIGGVVHQAFVDVNEEGTEAAAATAVTLRTLSISRPLVFRADHPFLFLIVEQQSGSILFLGRVTDPSK